MKIRAMNPQKAFSQILETMATDLEGMAAAEIYSRLRSFFTHISCRFEVTHEALRHYKDDGKGLMNHMRINAAKNIAVNMVEKEMFARFKGVSQMHRVDAEELFLIIPKFQIEQYGIIDLDTEDGLPSVRPASFDAETLNDFGNQAKNTGE